ncbi:hypothetical protein ACEWPM_015655 [Roseovarius sp. S4756]|uniref:hypothetical protein n=1 Tax=Roseovarius maritimus TaxID=3342637 RepID=UPI00372C1030
MAFQAAAKLPGATFASVFGAEIYHEARKDLMNTSRRNGFSEQDRDVFWTRALTSNIRLFAGHSAAEGLEGAPDPEVADESYKKSIDFENAWKIVSRNDMRGGVMSGHDRAKLAGKTSSRAMNLANEMKNNGICKPVAWAMERGRELANGERDRAERQAGIERRKRGARQRQAER